MYNVTTINPLALFITFISGILMLFLSRKHCLIPFFLNAFLITGMQRIVFLGFDFTMLRLLICIGFIRITLRQEWNSLKLNNIDKIILLFVIMNIIIYTSLRGEYNAFVNRLGFGINVLGTYFLFRVLLHGFKDIELTLYILAFCSSIMAVAMLIEQITGKNYFSIFGGVPEYTVIRGGILRSQGVFSHPLTAGAFGATLIPLMAGIWIKNTRSKIIALLGITSGIMIVITSASSGPYLALLAGLIGLSAWFVRKKMNLILIEGLLILICLSIVMKAPIWALVGRVGVIGGSQGYHRYYLIDQAIKRFDEWWFLGTKSTDHWGRGMWDVTNQYIKVAVDGGAISLILFLLIIIICFRYLGRAIKMNEDNKKGQFIYWVFGCSLFTHCIAFIGQTYFGLQSYINWFLLLSVISCSTNLIHSKQ